MELVLVLLLALLIFGPDRIAKLGGELGKGISAFQEEMKQVNEEMDEENSTSEAV